MAAGSFVVVRRTISQTIVPYKDVEERMLLKRSNAKSTSLGFSSTNNVDRCGVHNNTQDAKKTHKSQGLERSRSEVCLRRKSSYIRGSSLDVFEERPEEGLAKPIVRRREIRRVNKSRPQSDFFPEFSINSEKTVELGSKEKAPGKEDAGKRLGRCIATLKREMKSLRKQDQELLKQLTSLNKHIQDLKEIAKTRGGVYGSIEDHEDIKQSPSTSSSDPTTNPSMNRKSSSGNDRVENTETNKKESAKKLTVGKRIKNDIKGLQETSFEYIEVPCSSLTSNAVRAKAAAKRSQSTTAADFSRKKISSVRLERKSLSCQFLNSERRTKKNSIAESHETLASTGSRKTRPLSQVDPDHSRNLNEVIMKQKSLSLSQLRPSTKTTEGSTSDSEYSTSGCYGGSSTGSDMEVERGHYNGKSGCSESKERLDKLIELNSLNLKPIGKRHLAINTQGPHRKKVVSV